MTATNHALTGAVIGFSVGNPFLAIPIAFLSHYLLDAFPHYASKNKELEYLGSKTFKSILLIDISLCILLVIILAILHPQNWFLASICAFLATSPDLGHINMFIKSVKNLKWHPSRYAKFASVIQWYQEPNGAYIEAAWFVLMVIILGSYI